MREKGNHGYRCKADVGCTQERGREDILKYEDIAPVNIGDYLSAYKAVKTEIQEKITGQKRTVFEQMSIKLMEAAVNPIMVRRLAGKIACINHVLESMPKQFAGAQIKIENVE